MSDSLPRKLANALGFQLTWFASVWGGAEGLLWPGAVCIVLFTALTLMHSATRAADLKMLLIVVPSGFALDSLMVTGSVYQFAHSAESALFAPPWIAFLWVGFALTLNHSLAFLRTNLPLASLFGLVGAPLSYWAAHTAFAGVSFIAPQTPALALLGLAWAAALPLWLKLHAGLTGVRAS